MTIFTTMSNRKSYRYLPTFIQGSAVFLVAAVLSACGQSDIDASNASPVEAETTQVAQVVAENPADNTDLLKNVSATIYKDANCGCCKEWIEHTQSYGLHSTVEHPADLLLIKDRYGVPAETRSCHTAITTDGYVFEGHVPAKYVAEFLQNPPAQAIGLAVPGMPVGSPGMEYQGQFAPYQIMQINKDGTKQVYVEVESAEQQL